MYKNRLIFFITLILMIPLTIFVDSRGNFNNRRPADIDQAQGVSDLTKSICRQYSQYEDFDCSMIHGASWFKNRDNTLIEADDEVGRSMVTLFTRQGSFSMGTKVYCPKNPGTILASAHGVLDKNDEYTPSQNIYGVSAFPVSIKNSSKVSYDSQVITPGNANNWDDYATDFAFIIPDKDVNPDVEGVKIMSANSMQTQRLSESYETFLYRGSPELTLNGERKPFFDSSPGVTKLSQEQRFFSPYRVKDKCRVAPIPSVVTLSTTDCPVEGGVSGSSMVTYTDGTPYITGVVEGGQNIYMDRFVPEAAGSNFLNSAYVCEKYRDVCGVACAEPPESIKNNTMIRNVSS